MNQDIQTIRDSISKIVSMLTQQKIKVTQRGVKAYVAYHPTTGAIQSVNVPYLPDDASPEFIAAVQGFLDHEVGHVLFTEQKWILEGAKKGKRVASLHNVIEDVLIERRMATAFQGSNFNLESVRKFFLEKISRPKIKEALAVGDKVSAEGYAIVPAFRAWGGQVSAQDFIKDPAIAALVAPIEKALGPELIARLQKIASTKESLDLAVDMLKALTPPPAPPPPPASSSSASPQEEQDEQDEPEKSDDGDGAPSKENSAAPKDDEEKGKEQKPKKGGQEEKDAEPEDGDGNDDDQDGGDEEGSGSGSADGEAPDGEGEGDDQPGNAGGEAGDDGQPGEQSSGDASDAAGDEAAGTRTGEELGGGQPPGEEDVRSELVPGRDLGELFDSERDFDDAVSEELSRESERQLEGADYRIYSTEWDVIEPARISTLPNAIEQLERGSEGALGVMQKQLERAIAAQAKKAWNPGQRKGRLNPNGLYRTAAGDDRVFRTRFETRAKNTAVSLLVDCSGSMTWGSKIDLAARSAYALSTVLERIRVTHEVIGFTTRMSRQMTNAMNGDATEKFGPDDFARDEALFMPVFKGFSERLTSDAKKRLAGAVTHHDVCRNNVDGECVQIAAHRLRQQKAERHVLIVLSDGEPNCGCGGVAAGMLRSHLKKSVMQVEAGGVEVIGIGIQSAAVRNYYRKSIVLNDLAQLPTTVMGELTKMLMAK